MRTDDVNDPTTETATSPKSGVWLLLAVLVAAVIVVAIVALGSNDDAATPGSPTAAPTVEIADDPVAVAGTPLPPYDSTVVDPAVGDVPPAIRGVAPDGSTVELTAEGPRVIAVVAHWCPHCQVEVPAIVKMLGSDSWPADVKLAAVSTAQDRTRGNWPPSKWLAQEGWNAPVLVDDAAKTAATALGTTSFPYLIGIDANGTVAWRHAGEITPADLAPLVASLSADAPHTTVTVEPQ